MTDKQASVNIPLVSTETKNTSGISFFLLAMGIAMVALQAKYLLQPTQSVKGAFPNLFPALMALLLFLATYFLQRRRELIEVFVDQIKGKRTSGLQFKIPMVDIKHVDFVKNRLALKDLENRVLLIETISDVSTGGIIWMLKEYSEWNIRIWEHFHANQGDKFEKATRIFHGSDGIPNFGDVGFLIPVDNEVWYFPKSTIAPFARPAGQDRIYLRSSGTEATLFQLEPSPENLPLSDICAAILNSGLPNSEILSLIELLAENHGGNRCTSLASEAYLTGEYEGYDIKINRF